MIYRFRQMIALIDRVFTYYMEAVELYGEMRPEILKARHDISNACQTIRAYAEKFIRL